MRKSILLLVAVAFSVVTFAQTTVNLSLGAGYSNQVFFNLEDLTHQDVDVNSWDIAFFRESSYNFGIRINDAKGWEAYEVSNNIADWNTIDVTNTTNWDTLYNSDTIWTKGAFDNGSASYGWGEYNSVNHHVNGSVIFVLKDANGIFTKIKIDDFFGAYTFTYSLWDATSQTWATGITKTVANTENPEHVFNYYAFSSAGLVTVEPNAWDLVFTKYTTNLGGGMMYAVAGVLNNPHVTVAEFDLTSGTPDYSLLNYDSKINAIGYDWKSYDMGAGAYAVNSDIAYFVKTEQGDVYKVIFQTYEGASTGNLSFTVNQVTNTTAITSFEKDVNVVLYPNPASDKVSLSVNGIEGNTSVIAKIYGVNGTLYQTLKFKNNSTQETLNITNLKAGIYFVSLTTTQGTTTKKLIVK